MSGFCHLLRRVVPQARDCYLLTITQKSFTRQFCNGSKQTLSEKDRDVKNVETFNKLNKVTLISEDLSNDVEEPKVFEKDGPLKYFDCNPPLQNYENFENRLLNTMLVYPNFISQEEEMTLMKELEPYISRLHYESSHWDDAIHEYRETERSRWNKKNELVINRIRKVAFPPQVPQLKLVHILDLAKKGVIKPHIDSVRFCGNTIAGLSLLSDSIMRLIHDVHKDLWCDVLLPRYSLYVMKDFARYEFTHEILSEPNSIFKSQKVFRDRRISIICRNEPTEIHPEPEPVFKSLE